MSANVNNRGPQDRARINVNEDHELRYCSDKFGVTAETLTQRSRTAVFLPMPSNGI